MKTFTQFLRTKFKLKKFDNSLDDWSIIIIYDDE